MFYTRLIVFRSSQTENQNFQAQLLSPLRGVLWLMLVGCIAKIELSKKNNNNSELRSSYRNVYFETPLVKWRGYQEGVNVVNIPLSTKYSSKSNLIRKNLELDTFSLSLLPWIISGFAYGLGAIYDTTFCYPFTADENFNRISNHVGVKVHEARGRYTAHTHSFNFFFF